MNRKQKITRLLACLALVIVLVGCSTPTIVAQPTQDIPAVRTEAAKTVVAKITIEAALQPTATTAATVAAPEPIVITATAAEPTATTAATATPLPTATLIPTSRPPAGGGSGGVLPTATRRAGPDQAQLVSQSPTDGTDYARGDHFDGVWNFKNIGTSTWSTGYEVRFARGTNFAGGTNFALSKSVAPGESIQVIVDMIAPADSGRYVGYWELLNENGDVFYQFYVVIDVK